MLPVYPLARHFRAGSTRLGPLTGSVSKPVSSPSQSHLITESAPCLSLAAVFIISALIINMAGSIASMSTHLYLRASPLVSLTQLGRAPERHFVDRSTLRHARTFESHSLQALDRTGLLAAPTGACPSDWCATEPAHGAGLISRLVSWLTRCPAYTKLGHNWAASAAIDLVRLHSFRRCQLS